ncbi:MAG: META domain-containing protein, partial [Thermaurantiacus tibetensis]
MRHPAVVVLAALAAGCMPVEKRAGRGEAVTKAVEPTAAGVPAALDREWAVFELGGEAVTGRSPTIGFGDGRVFGFAGCNRYTGPVGFTGGDGIRVGAAAMTMMAMHERPAEATSSGVVSAGSPSSPVWAPPGDPGQS